jgi:glycosyltransferase involved in cell wall biosynthesis/SAM-dependent methyltransferase
MRALVLSHSTTRSGGAEVALFELVEKLLEQNHEIVVLYSNPKGGDEIDRYIARGVRVLNFDCPWVVPDFAQGMFTLSNFVNWENVVSQIRPLGFTHVLSNTIVQLHGAILASYLEVPHILYAHEYVSKGLAFDLHPSGIGGEKYCALLSKCSDEIWACSKYVASQFPRGVVTKVVYPRFKGASPGVLRSRPFDPSKPITLVCVGMKSVRKNVAFFLILAKAVGLLGMPANFKWVGGIDMRGKEVIDAHIRRRAPLRGPVSLEMIPHTSNPFESILLDHDNVVLMIGSHSEPFGLTAIEAMERGVPVISSRCGGPEELLPPEQLFDVDDIHGAVQCLKYVRSNYDDVVGRSFEFVPSPVEISCGYRPKPFVKEMMSKFRALHLSDRTPERVFELVRRVFPDVPESLLRFEHEHPGSLVLSELSHFGATPFSYSDKMDAFYRDGVSMAIQLADTMHDQSKEIMLSFVLSHFLLDDDASSPPRILSVGDGIANDSIRLARAGLSVSYLDFDEGKMTEIAKLNVADAGVHVDFVTDSFANENPFEFLMCFEVFEHVPEPDVLVRSLAEKTRPGGYVWVSECFFGLQDQWSPHLYSNEVYSGLLPSIMDPWFELVEVHRSIPGKPFMFRRTSLDASVPVPSSRRRWFMNSTTHNLIRHAFEAKTNSLIYF